MEVIVRMLMSPRRAQEYGYTVSGNVILPVKLDLGKLSLAARWIAKRITTTCVRGASDRIPFVAYSAHSPLDCVRRSGVPEDSLQELLDALGGNPGDPVEYADIEFPLYDEQEAPEEVIEQSLARMRVLRYGKLVDRDAGEQCFLHPDATPLDKAGYYLVWEAARAEPRLASFLEMWNAHNPYDPGTARAGIARFNRELTAIHRAAHSTLREVRASTGLTQKAFAARLRLGEKTLRTWETSVSTYAQDVKPFLFLWICWATRYLEKPDFLLGRYDDHDESTPPDSIKTLRGAESQAKFAARIGVTLRAIQNWEIRGSPLYVRAILAQVTGYTQA